MISYTINGIIREEESGVPLQGIYIKAYDKDLLFDDLLGSATSDSNGNFTITCEPPDFRDFFEKKPDIYFKVFNTERNHVVFNTKKAVRWNVGRVSKHEILIPWEKIQDGSKPRLVLLGDDNKPREDFAVGESLTVHLKGLRPASPCNFELSVGRKLLFTSTLLSDRRGEISQHVLWPQIGLDDPHSQELYTPVEAEKKWADKKISLRVSQGKKIIVNTVFTISRNLRAPIVISSDTEGRLNNGFELNKSSAHLTIYNLPFGGDVRIYMVNRQHEWNTGDQFRISALRDGSPAIREIRINEGGTQQTFEFATAEALLPGAYDFIVRPLRYGYEEDESHAVLLRDVIGSRRVTGLVIREAFWTAKPVLGGCVNKIPISGASVIGAPYFEYRDTFTFGEDVWAGLDPGIVDPGNISKMCALYVIQSKDGAGWADNSLNHIFGNASVTKHKMQAGCMNANKILVWPNVQQVGNYDIVADFGNNTADAASFVQDNQYNTPLDMIDGYFTSGFRVLPDPGTMVESSISNYGNWNYTEADVASLGLSGTVTIQDSSNQYHSSGSPMIVSRQLRLKAHVFFPADTLGITDPAQISLAQPNYPLIVIIHGNGQSYTAYDFLLQHFARNGFIAASIDVRYFNGSVEAHGMGAQGRAEALFHHLTVINTKFGAKVQNNIGIMGHSRGGEAVIKAARFNQQQTLGHNINAVISLAPTDQYGTETLSGLWSKPYFVLYGSRDGDIDGGIWVTGYTVPMTGFAQYDRAAGSPKSMCFVYKATHNGFITANSDSGDGDLISVSHQRAFTLAYMNAFFRWHLKNEPHWQGMFAGEWTPGSVKTTGATFQMQYRPVTGQVVDEFEGALNWQSSTIGGTVSQLNLPANPEENKMSAAIIAGLDPKSPHDTQGMKIRWDNFNDAVLFSVPAASKDVSGYTFLSFRITQKADSASNPVNQSQDIRVALKDGANNERAVRVSPFYTIPFPEYRPDHSLSKSAMASIRIPLVSYRIVCAGMAAVDLANISTLSFVFSEKQTGEIEIDNVEFVN